MICIAKGWKRISRSLTTPSSTWSDRLKRSRTPKNRRTCLN
ncbi:hypothetical protein DSM3645_04043 [Blastopirellula marina DSM 3645]|uniref:Uncharacterized protein n=1 Tax=Blastopirellula marina DSM 3645 TaxID=314230 RepID=A3ZV52_9BACT|nr:hypothetical protein DSM3645_04043 [Blastopirellula marina DSM 3645]